MCTCNSETAAIDLQGYSRGKTGSRLLSLFLFFFFFSFALISSPVCADVEWVGEKIRRLQTKQDLESR